jgi:hypothetical protein
LKAESADVAVNEPGAIEFPEDREDPSGAVHVLHVIVRRRGDLAEIGDLAREAVHVLHAEVHAGLRASFRQFMLLAVNMPEQEPHVGRAAWPP